MQRRVGMFASVLIIIALVACRTQTLSEEDDKKAAIAVVLAHGLACQTYDFDLDSLHTRDSRGIEESYPHPSEPDLRQCYQVDKDAGVHIDYHPQDVVAEVRGNVA